MRLEIQTHFLFFKLKRERRAKLPAALFFFCLKICFLSKNSLLCRIFHLNLSLICCCCSDSGYCCYCSDFCSDCCCSGCCYCSGFCSDCCFCFRTDFRFCYSFLSPCVIMCRTIFFIQIFYSTYGLIWSIYLYAIFRHSCH